MYVAGASIPYPVNYIINFMVFLLFVIVILILACWRMYKERDARARRQKLTSKRCLDLNMDGVKGRYPPKKIKRLLELNEVRRQREAEAAEREYEMKAIDAEADDGVESATPQEQPETKTGEERSDAAQDRASDAAADARPATTTTHAADAEATSSGPAAADEPQNAAEGGAVIPTFVLPDEQQSLGTSGGVSEPDAAAEEEGKDNAESAAAALPSVGRSQNNATKQQYGQEHGDEGPPQVTSASTATQTYPPEDTEQNATSSDGSFDDSVVSV